MRKAARIALPLLALALLTGGIRDSFTPRTEQPRCCLTWANARCWQLQGYGAGQTTRQIEDAIYAQCYAIGCQWQPELGPGGCPSQWGVEEVAASWGLPGYENAARWDWAAFVNAAGQGRAITHFWTGPDYSGPNGLMHSYCCDQVQAGQFYCYDALNQAGRWWDAAELYSHWSGWASAFGPVDAAQRVYLPAVAPE